MPVEKAGTMAALVVLSGALGSVIWGAVADRAGRRALKGKLYAVIALTLASMVTLIFAFAAPRWGFTTTASSQIVWIMLGAFLAANTVGPVVAIVINVMHPSVRATGASVLALFQNLFGLAAGPLIAGVLSDHWGLQTTMIYMPLFSLLAALMFLFTVGTYEADVKRVREQIAAQSKDDLSPLGGENAAKPVAGH
jgi:MFS family permease